MILSFFYRALEENPLLVPVVFNSRVRKTEVAWIFFYLYLQSFFLNCSVTFRRLVALGKERLCGSMI